VVFQLTVKKNVNDSRTSPAAAIRVHRSSRVPSPTASSPRAMSRLTRVGACADSVSNGPMGLLPRSKQHLVGCGGGVAWIEVAGVSQLLQAGVGEPQTKEDPQGQESPLRMGEPPKPATRHGARCMTAPSLHDPEGIITARHDNATARTVAVRQGETINAHALTAMFKHIIANNRAGGWRKVKREGWSRFPSCGCPARGSSHRENSCGGRGKPRGQVTNRADLVDRQVVAARARPHSRNQRSQRRTCHVSARRSTGPSGCRMPVSTRVPTTTSNPP
jgi:hypothetical protein